MVNNTYQQLSDDSCKEFDWSDVIDNGIGGVIGAGAGGVIGTAGTSILRDSTQRAIRRIISGAYPKGANYGTIGAVSGAAVGEGLASKTSNSIDKKTDKWGLDTTIDLSTVVTPW